MVDEQMVWLTKSFVFIEFFLSLMKYYSSIIRYYAQYVQYSIECGLSKE